VKETCNSEFSGRRDQLETGSFCASARPADAVTLEAITEKVVVHLQEGQSYDKSHANTVYLIIILLLLVTELYQ
jgi:hypothetical protein